MSRITSLQNQHIKLIRALRLRKVREQHGIFVVEGRQALLAALARGALIELLIVAPELSAPLCKLPDAPLIEVSAEVFGRICDKETARGVAALVRQRWQLLEQLEPQRGCVVFLEGIQFPGNLGTIVRTADAIGAAGVVLVGATADPYDSVAVRASTSAIFAQTLVRASYHEVARWSRRRRVALVGASPEARLDFRAVRYPAQVGLVFGSEGAGISAQMRTLCETLVRIPMAGESDSLNLAVAASLVMFEATRR